jgi:hypothetical protein
MPYDYPGDYRGRFDGIDDATPSFTFERLSAPNLVQGLKPSPTGTLTFHSLKGANPRGAMLIDQWYRSSGGGTGPSRNLIIEVARAKSVVERWHVVGAQPRKWVLKAASAGNGPIAVESLEIVHLGMRRG